LRNQKRKWKNQLKKAGVNIEVLKDECRSYSTLSDKSIETNQLDQEKTLKLKKKKSQYALRWRYYL
jgi:hypothetical protein